MADASTTYLLNKFDNFLSKEVKLRGSIKENIVELKNEKDMITEVLQSADTIKVQGGQTPMWIQQLRIINYDLQRILNTHAYKDATPWHGRVTSTRSYNIAEMISKMQERLKNVKGNREAYQITLPSHPASTSSEHGGGIAPLYTPEEEIVGIEGAREKLASWALDVRQAYRARFVVGKAGSGKTALVRLVYEQLKTDFDCHAWLTASMFGRKEELLSTMSNKLCKGTTVSSSTPSEDHIEVLREYLQNKRYLVVLDDWNREDWWEVVKYAFPNGNNNSISRVILTTRRGDIASACRDNTSVDTSRMEPLPFEKAEELFCRIAFPETGKYPSVPGLREVCWRLLRACEGSPFEIIKIGEHLSKEAKSLSVFEKFERNLQDELQLKLPSIPRKLLSDYSDLPDHLKACFLFMVMFPEGHPVNCRMLIRLWMAAGFIREGSQNEPEDIGESYLLELIGRNLVLACELEIDGRPRTCRLHNILHKIVLSRSQNVDFCTVTGFSSTIMQRLSMQNSGINFSDESLHHVHTFCSPCMGTSIPKRILLNMNHLKILHLDRAILTKALSEGTKEMLLLKYLSLRNTGIKKVPTITGKLLETLNLKQTPVTVLPDSLADQKNLRHLRVGRYRFKSRLTFDAVEGVRAPKGIGRLTNLQTLSFVTAEGGHKLIKELQNLKKLRKLGIVDLPSDSGPIWCETIQKLTSLRSLSLISEEMNVVLDIQGINNPPHLQRLYLWGRLERMPWWISKLHELVIIRLRWSRLEAAQDPISILGNLSNLLELQLIDAYKGNQLHFSAGTFLKLKILEFEQMEELQVITIDNGALPCLETLSISLCVNLREIPIGIANIDQLRNRFGYGQ